MRLCAGVGSFAGTTEDLTLEMDPAAAELVALAQQRLADELDLSTHTIEVVEVSSYAWPDSSLGCPQPGEDYRALVIAGYRIVLAAGDTRVHLPHQRKSVDPLYRCPRSPALIRRRQVLAGEHLQVRQRTVGIGPNLILPVAQRRVEILRHRDRAKLADHARGHAPQFGFAVL